MQLTHVHFAPCSGVSVTFLIGFLLMILAALMFFFGAGAQKICLAMEGPGYPLFTEVSIEYVRSLILI